MILTIDPEITGDAGEIHNVVGRAFHEQPAVADLVDQIRYSEGYIAELALTARADAAVVGFVMFSRAHLLAPDGTFHDVLTLSPLAVAPEYQRRGIGSALVRAGLVAADGTGAGLVTLEGSPQYYGRLGFQFAPDFGVSIDLPEWAPKEAAQVYLLKAYNYAVRGRLHYPPAFAAVQG